MDFALANRVRETNDKRESPSEEKSIEIITEFQKVDANYENVLTADILAFHKTTNHHPSNHLSRKSRELYFLEFVEPFGIDDIGYHFSSFEIFIYRKVYKREWWTGFMALDHLLLLFSTLFNIHLIKICSINGNFFHSNLCCCFFFFCLYRSINELTEWMACETRGKWIEFLFVFRCFSFCRMAVTNPHPQWIIYNNKDEFRF